MSFREEFFSATQSPLPCILEYSENLRARKEGQGIDGNASLALPLSHPTRGNVADQYADVSTREH